MTVHAQALTSTDDPLEGQWELRVTDLVLYQTHSADSNTKSEILNYYLETEDSKVVTQTAKTILAAPAGLGSEPQITAPRLFPSQRRRDHDGAVGNAGNPDCASTNSDSNMGSIVDTKTNAAPIWVHFFASAKQTAMAMADFNQDGLEDLFHPQRHPGICCDGNRRLQPDRRHDLWATDGTRFDDAGAGGGAGHGRLQ
ncbi:MAG: hypothetical protein H6646_00415 [Anaerolineales bacterium]|nr:hypothetical protein [Anaerolineales bacterium]